MHNTIPIAENHISITRALFDEAMNAVGSKAYKKAVHKMIILLLIVYLTAAVFLLYTGGSLLLLLGESIFLGALLFWMLVMLPGTRHRSKYKAMCAGGSGIPERTVRFYQDQLSVLSDTGKETVIAYSDVESCQETGNLYLLNCKNHFCVLLDKNGFVLGDFHIVKEVIDGLDDQVSQT